MNFLFDCRLLGMLMFWLIGFLNKIKNRSGRVTSHTDKSSLEVE
jgi:hypothetical protein